MSQIVRFATLYKKTATGALQQWDIYVEYRGGAGGCIVTQWGQVDGEAQETTDLITKGKSVGKANETSPWEQACCEAEARWTKQKKKGYVETPEQAMAGGVDETVIGGGIAPMLAEKFSECADDIVWPCYAQKKYDGMRCIAVVVDGKATLWSRTRKPINSVPHIVKALEEAARGKSFVADGELYNHDLKADFEKLISVLRKKEPAPGHEIAQYHIYDLPSCDRPFSERNVEIHKLFYGIDLESTPLRLAETCLLETEEDMELKFDEFLAAGYEGLMLRNAASLYENRRSRGLQKVKEFQDAEFEIVGVEEGRGKLAGHAVFVCKTTEGKTFNAKMKGEQEKLKEYFENAPEYIGQQLTVKYQNMSKYGVPRFPVGLRLRKDL